MVGGMERYYQIARCLRDEDLRADRQFEFMQLDMEASFVGQEEVLGFVSEVVADATEAVTGQRPGTIDRITWHDAIDRYGSDKPDTRFGMELVEVTEVFAKTDFNAFKASCIKGIRVEGGASFGRNKLDGLTDDAKRWGAKGLVWIKVDRGGRRLAGGEVHVRRREGRPGAGDGRASRATSSCWWPTSGPQVCHVLGLLRLALGRPPVNEGGQTFLWVVDFPLFESLSDDGKPIPAHHPFTMPHLDDWDMLDGTGAELLQVRSQAYDLTLNGWELGSGSVRIHRTDVQSRIFDLLGIGREEAELKFGFLLEAFRYGAPPHAGFAFGIDRLAALLAGEENIREIIAFPKTQSGTDPLTGAPTDPDPAQLAELGIRVSHPRRDVVQGYHGRVAPGSPSGAPPERRGDATCSRAAAEEKLAAPGAAGRPHAADPAGRHRRPGRGARAGQAAAGADRGRPPVVGDPLGTARHRQDDPRPGDRPQHVEGVRAALRRERDREGRPRGGGPRQAAAGGAGPGHHPLPRRGPPLHEVPAGRAAAVGRGGPAHPGRAPPPRTRTSRSTRRCCRARRCSASSPSTSPRCGSWPSGAWPPRAPKPTRTRSPTWSTGPPATAARR